MLRLIGVTGGAYLLGLAAEADGTGAIEPLARFKANPAGSAIVNAAGPIRQIINPEDGSDARRHLVIAEDVAGKPGAVLQVQAR